MAIPKSILTQIQKDTEEKQKNYALKVEAWKAKDNLTHTQEAKEAKHQQAQQTAQNIAQNYATKSQQRAEQEAQKEKLEQYKQNRAFQAAQRKANIEELQSIAQDREYAEKRREKSVREYLGLPTGTSSGPEGAKSQREIMEDLQKQRAEIAAQEQDEKASAGDLPFSMDEKGTGFSKSKREAPEELQRLRGDKASAGDLAFAMAGKGAGIVNSGFASGADWLANLPGRVEAAIENIYIPVPESWKEKLGLPDYEPVSADETLLGQLMRPATDATQMLKDYTTDTTQKLGDYIDENTAYNKAANVALNLGADVISALPNAVLAVMSSGASAVPELGTQAVGLLGTVQTALTKLISNPMFHTSFLQTVGTSYDEAIADGATETEALLASTLSSAFNAAVEIGGGVETLPQEIRNVDLSTGQKAWEWAKSALDEGKEELIQGIIERLTNKAIFDSEKPWVSTTDENAVFNPYVSAQEAGMGTLVGGILGGGQVLADTVMNRNRVNNDRIGASQPSGTVDMDTVIQETLKPTQDQSMMDKITEGIFPQNTAENTPQTESMLDKVTEGIFPQTQLNIDNTDAVAYNEINENGGVQNGRNNQLDGTSGEGVRAGRDSGTTDSRIQGGRGNGQENLSVPGIVLLSPEAQQTLTERGIVNIELHDSSMDNAAFSSALDAARAADAINGWAVTPKNANELTETGTRTFLDRNGSTGFAIAPDGDIEAVFANKAAGAPKGSTKSTMPQAIANGGTKLDCYGSDLVKLYSKYGFVPVARVTFDPEYANPGWTADKGTPEIYFMMHNGDSADTVVQNMGKYKAWSKAELEALPLMEYDEAYRYRDSLLNGRRTESNGKSAMDQADVGDLGAKTSEFRHEVVENQGKTTPDYYEQNNIPEEGRNENVHTVIHEDESLHNARVRLEQDYDGEVEYLKTKTTWSGEEMDMGQMVKDDLRTEAQETGDWSKFREWDKVCEEHKTEGGRALQALAKQNRNSVDQILTDASAYLDKAKRGTDVDGVMQTVSESADRMQAAVETGNVDELVSIIKETARERKTASFGGKLSKPLDWALNRIADYARGDAGNGLSADMQEITAADITKPEAAMAFLQNFAANGIRNIAADKQKGSVTKAAMTIRRNAMLSKFSTTMRNLVGNAGFDLADTVSRDISVPLDMLLSKFTGTRSTAIDKYYVSKAKRQGTLDGLAMATLETALDVDGRRNSSKYGVSSQRTFKMSGGVVSKCMSLWEESMGFRMYVTDEMAKGGTSSEIQRGLDKLYEQGKIKDDSLRTGGADEALYRTFQDENMASKTVLGVRNALDNVHVGEAGLGKMLLPFAQVPSNLVARTMDYSPVGLANGVYQLAQVLNSAKNGTLTAAQQAKAVQTIGRGINGTGMIAILTGLAIKGIIRVVNPGGEDENKDKAAFEKMQGQSGAQLNLSSFGRMFTGGSTEWQDGDKLMSIGFADPFNAHMNIAAMLAEDLEAEGQLTAKSVKDATLDGVLASILDLPMFDVFSEVYDAYQYSTADTTGGKMQDAAKALLANEVSSFIPNSWKGIAQGLDPYQRDLYSKDTYTGQIEDQFRAVFDRDSLPIKQDSFGRDMTNPGGVLNFLNSNILPGQITEYKTDDVLDKITDLSGLTGSTSVYPSRKAPDRVTVDGEDFPLSAEQRREYQQIYGTTDYSTREALYDNEAYQNLDSKAELKANSYSEQYATQTAKEAMDVGFEPEAWVKELEGKSPSEIADAIILKTFESLASDTKKYDSKYDGITDMLENGVLEEAMAITMLPEAAQTGYYDHAKGAGIAVEDYIKLYQFKKDATSDRDADGKEIKTAQQKVIEYIDRTWKSNQQKRAAFLSLYVEKNCPW